MGRPNSARRIVDGMARRGRDRTDHPPERVFSVTTAPTSRVLDQDTRIRRYLWTMGVRTGCFIVAVIATGWIRWVAVGAAVVLPYVAVILANAVGPRQPGTVPAVTPYIDPTIRIGDAPHPPDQAPGRADGGPSA
jgi:hypothetical protein